MTTEQNIANDKGFTIRNVHLDRLLSKVCDSKSRGQMFDLRLLLCNDVIICLVFCSFSTTDIYFHIICFFCTDSRFIKNIVQILIEYSYVNESYLLNHEQIILYIMIESSYMLSVNENAHHI